MLPLLATRHSYASDPSKSDLLKAMGNVLTDKLAPLYRRCLPMERKWLTRLIMKSYAPIAIPEDLVLGLYHIGLPAMVKLFDLKAAIRFCHRMDQDSVPEPDADAPPMGQDPLQNAGNGENHQPAVEGQSGQPKKQQERGNPSRQVPPLNLPKPSSTDEPDKASSNSSNFISPRDWIDQPLLDITNTAGNKLHSQTQNEKSPLSPPVIRRASQAVQSPEPAAQAPSTTRPACSSRSSHSSGSQGHCTKDGRHCLFYKRDIALLPPLSRSTAIRKMLDKHKAVPMDIEKFIEGKLGGRRQVLLVDQTADGLEAAYDRIRATHTYDARGRKQWVDIYDWHLLGFINTHGTCREKSQGCWRRYWVGTA